MDIKVTIAQKMKQVRKDRRLSQKEVAEIFGLTQAAVSNYEKGTRIPDYNYLYSYATYFKVSLDYLFGITNREEGGILKPEFVHSLSSGAEGLYGNPDAPGAIDIDGLKKLIESVIIERENKKNED